MKSLNETILLNDEGINHAATLIEQKLAAEKVASEDIVTALETINKALRKWCMALEPNTELRLKVYIRFGSIKVVLRAPGLPVNPLPKTEINTDFNLFHSALLSYLLKPINYDYHGGVNELEIKFDKPAKPKTATAKILIALFFAIAAGVLLDIALPKESCVFIAKEITGPLAKQLMGLLSGVAGLMIFVTMTSSVCNMGDVSTLSGIGKGTMKQLMLRVLLASIIFLPLGVYLFDVSSTSSKADMTVLKDVYKLILGLIPTNTVQPFVKGDTMQIIIFAILSGYTLLQVGQKAKALAGIINELSDFTMAMVNTVCRLLPLIVFLSAINIVLKGNFLELAKLWKMLLFNFLGVGVFLAGTLIYISYRCRLPLKKLAQDLLPIFLLGGTTMSSPPCLSIIDSTCRDKYQVEDNLRSFAVPFGQQLYMSYHVINVISYLVGMADIFGTRFDISTIIMLFICCNIMVYTIPPIPMGIMTIMALMFNIAGIPAEGLAIAMSIDFVMAMTRMAAKVAGVTAEIIYLDQELKAEANAA